MLIFFRNIFTIKSDKNKQRDGLLDFLRGSAMILVLLHHSRFPLGDYILIFHMPLFFILAGYLEYLRKGINRSFKEYLRRRFIRLIIPYFGFEILNLAIFLIICIVMKRPIFLKASIISIITCVNNEYAGLYGRLWFLPCMFIADLYVLFILKYYRENDLVQHISIIFLFFLSFVKNAIIPFRLPFTMDTALFGAGFIMFGYCFGKTLKILMNKSNEGYKIILGCCAIIYVIYAVRHENAKILMYNNFYSEYTIAICAAISGSFAFIIFVSLIYNILNNNFINNFILWYSLNSLSTFPVHLTIKMFIIWCIPILKHWYILFIIMLITNIPIVNFIRLYFPYILGEKNVNIYNKKIINSKTP